MESKKLTGFLRENCIVCHNQISFTKDRYVRLTDFNGKRKEAQCFYHLDCWKNRNAIAQKKAMQKFAETLFSHLPKVEKEEQYAI
jgi:hypothetical protein